MSKVRFVGLDVHADAIAVAVAEGQRIGRLGNASADQDAAVFQLDAERLHGFRVR